MAMEHAAGFLVVLVALAISLLASLTMVFSYLSGRDVFNQRMVFVLAVFSVLYTASRFRNLGFPSV